MFLESRLERLLDKLRRTVPVPPLRLELWDGRAFDPSTHPTVKIGMPHATAGPCAALAGRCLDRRTQIPLGVFNAIERGGLLP
mgnify:CR=1 FL=1